MKRGSIWDYLAWVALLSIVVWLILKVMGLINTPLWIEYAPLFSASYIAGWLVHTLKTATEDIKSLKKEVSGINNNLNCLNQDMKTLKARCPNFTR